MLGLLTFLAQEHAAEESDPARFVLPHGDELLWGSIVFFILFGSLLFFTWPRIKKVLADRTAKIRAGLEESEKAKAEAERLQEQYRRQLDEARGEAAKVVEEAKRTGDSLRKDIIAKAEQEAQEIVQRARQEVAGEAARARQQLQSELVNMSLQLATRVIERELAQPDAAKQLVERTINELAASGNGR
jgi:F-type H+-transporting ATPase subunit b